MGESLGFDHDNQSVAFLSDGVASVNCAVGTSKLLSRNRRLW